MMKPVEVPPEYTDIRDELVAWGIGEGPEPAGSKTLDKFRAWLIYQSGPLFMEAPSFVRVQCLSFSDEDLADDLGLNAGDAISNEQRLSYARDYIDSYDNGLRGLTFPMAFELRRRDGARTIYCAISDGGGQGGLYEEWVGCFSSLDALYEDLSSKGYWRLGDDSSKLSDERIMAQWYFAKK